MSAIEMPMRRNLYQIGYRAEAKAKDILKDWGYIPFRTAGSHGPFDLIGINAAQCIGVQVKVCPFKKLPTFNNEKKFLGELRVPANFKKELWVWEKLRGWHFFAI